VTLVIDASVAIKWFIREALHGEALRLLDRPDSLHAPDLLAAEVTNIAWKKSRVGEIGKHQAADIAKAIRQGTPVLYPSALVNERALELAFLLDHSVYDCLYLACAEAVSGTLITADAKFRRVAETAGFGDRVRLLSA
jgi:predicted nucleic acid-binding protein